MAKDSATATAAALASAATAISAVALDDVSTLAATFADASIAAATVDADASIMCAGVAGAGAGANSVAAPTDVADAITITLAASDVDFTHADNKALSDDGGSPESRGIRRTDSGFRRFEVPPRHCVPGAMARVRAGRISQFKL